MERGKESKRRAVRKHIGDHDKAQGGRMESGKGNSMENRSKPLGEHKETVYVRAGWRAFWRAAPKPHGDQEKITMGTPWRAVRGKP